MRRVRYIGEHTPDELARMKFGKALAALHDAEKLPTEPPPGGASGLPFVLPLASIVILENVFQHRDRIWNAMTLRVARALREACAIIGDNTPMANVKRPELDRIVHAWRQDGNSPATINRKLAAVSSVFKTALDLDVIRARPAWPKRLKEAAHKLRFIYPQEEKLLLATASSFDDHDLADLIVFALDTGARFSEIVKARWDWFSPELTSWTIWSRKANNPFAMPLTQRVQKMLAARRDRRGGPFASEVYWSVRHRLERILDKLQFDDVTFHTFRHTTASRLVQRGVDLRRVQVWMGHKAIATTIRYAKLAPNDLADVVQYLEPQHGARTFRAADLQSPILPAAGLRIDLW